METCIGTRRAHAIPHILVRSSFQLCARECAFWLMVGNLQERGQAGFPEVSLARTRRGSLRPSCHLAEELAQDVLVAASSRIKRNSSEPGADGSDPPLPSPPPPPPLPPPRSGLQAKLLVANGLGSSNPSDYLSACLLVCTQPLICMAPARLASGKWGKQLSIIQNHS